MENRKDRRASARQTAKWERQAAARIGRGDRSQRLKQRILSAAREDEIAEGTVTPNAELDRKEPPLQIQTDWLPLQAVAGMAATGFPAYIVAEAALSSRLHPLHWLAAVVGGLLGYAGGLLIYKRRGY